jgi:hypothetical protein
MKAIILFLCIPATAFSQIVISSSTQLSTANTPDIVITTGSNVTNSSAFDFSGTTLHLNLLGTNQTVSGNIVISRLGIGGGGSKMINGHMTIASEINFVAGYLQPSVTGKILFTGPESGLSGASAESFVDGRFYCTGTGLIRFPIGRQAVGFAPVTLESGPGGEVGIEVFNESAGLIAAPSEVEIVDIVNTPHWVISGDLASLNTRIKLTPPTFPLLPQDAAAIVVEADAPDGEAFNAGGTVETESSITSGRNITRPIITIGASTEVDITVHDLISPFKVDGHNDFLAIDNIDKFPTNKVTLLDRYGVLIKEWEDFSNFDDPSKPNTDIFNFTRLSPGNYICIVEYGNASQATRKKSQMITVLKN